MTFWQNKNQKMNSSGVLSSWALKYAPIVISMLLIPIVAFWGMGEAKGATDQNASWDFTNADDYDTESEMVEIDSGKASIASLLDLEWDDVTTDYIPAGTLTEIYEGDPVFKMVDIYDGPDEYTEVESYGASPDVIMYINRNISEEKSTGNASFKEAYENCIEQISNTVGRRWGKTCGGSTRICLLFLVLRFMT